VENSTFSFFGSTAIANEPRHVKLTLWRQIINIATHMFCEKCCETLKVISSIFNVESQSALPVVEMVRSTGRLQS
jgi:hypothetical protein